MQSYFIEFSYINIFILFQIENKKLDFKDKAQSKVGSKDHMNHKAGGGDKKVHIYQMQDFQRTLQLRNMTNKKNLKFTLTQVKKG